MPGSHQRTGSFDFSESCRSAYPDEPWLTLASARISQALEMHGRKIKDNFRFLMEYGFPAIEKAYARRDWGSTYLLAEKCQGRIQMNSYIFYPLPSDQVGAWSGTPGRSSVLKWRRRPS